MALLGTALGWDFKNNNLQGPSSTGSQPAPQQGSQPGSRRSTADSITVRAGQDWAELLLPAQTSDWLHALLPALRGQAMASPLAAAARHVVVAFCSLSASVFPKRDPQQLRLAYLHSMLKAVLLWAKPAAAALHQASANDEAELVDACRWGGAGLGRDGLGLGPGPAS
jgi:hypothetical protein